MNCNARLLGRYGVMSVMMVTDLGTLAAAIGDFRRRVQGFQSVSGQTCRDYQPGDHVAAFGLAAVITAGEATLQRSLLLDNLFDTMPTADHSYRGSTRTSYNPSSYNVFGRAIDLEASYKFGK